MTISSTAFLFLGIGVIIGIVSDSYARDYIEEIENLFRKT